MLLEFLFGQLLFLPLIYGSNITALNPIKSYNITMPLNESSSNNTKITLVTEGGAITQINSNLTLPKDNNTVLMDLNKELGTPKNRSIAARKGVKLEEYEHNESIVVNSMSNDDQITVKLNNTEIKKNHSSKMGNSSRIDSSLNLKSTEVKTTHKPHKPEVLSYDDLSGTNQNAEVVKTSSKTFISDQIPNPNADNTKSSMSDGNQPGMIMPVVITILTVPLFVALGFMALRRGREAWKNRHYKRMDFLLDGMYND
ncbi:uncharacterized protein LOC106131145 [Amyelois transitella]|uniref:uncharacterized protein LOC106131145 n=1 Tax=Amyelois transitella TaxID=680683 RepID=UPI00298F85B7|nr:uncharacterized protein LOC106131145 [Amyelois transitella]